ncbi:MAG: DUF1015 domain-containing protein, partial [Candidatus Omnitrophica bacterium]|nr:DUF1015 domain-containing protein [Candidatus Omnitrophota bacterium]
MPAIFPLRGIRYVPSAVGRLDRVVTPPYDVISPAAQEALYRKSPYNFIRVIYGRVRATDRPGRTRYTRARETFQAWLRDGILRMDAVPAIYPYRQRFLHGGRSFDRWGLMALIRLGEPSIVPHEETDAGPKDDRLQLLEAVQANLSPMFGLVDDPDRAYRAMLMRQAAPPAVSVMADGVQHDVWRITAPAAIHAAQGIVEARAMLVADGHHRYESAMAYRDAARRRRGAFTGQHPANFMLAYLAACDADDPGILPTHRVFHGMAGWSLERLAGYPAVSVRRVPDEAAMRRAVDHWTEAERPAVGCYAGDGQWAVISLTRPDPSAQVDVELLHRIIVPQGIAPAPPEVTYTHVWSEAAQSVARGQGCVAWYLRSLTLPEIVRCVRGGRRLPQKSTYFTPKPLSGLVVHRLQPVLRRAAGALPHDQRGETQPPTPSADQTGPV